MEKNKVDTPINWKCVNCGYGCKKVSDMNKHIKISGHKDGVISSYPKYRETNDLIALLFIALVGVAVIVIARGLL